MYGRRNSRVEALLFWAGAASCVAFGCVRSHDRPRTEGEPDDQAEGDPAGAFADISVLVQTYEGFNDPIRSTARTPSSQSAYLVINEGTSEGRVPGLRIFLGGAELDEIGNAAFPQHFSYQGPEQAVGEHPIALRLQLGEASFSYPLELSSVDLSAPEKGEELITRGEFVVRWTGGGAAPDVGIAPVAGSTCELLFGVPVLSEGQAVYSVTGRPELDTGVFSGAGLRSCRADVSTDWNFAAEPVNDTPFASFVVSREVRRTHRFLLTLWR